MTEVALVSGGFAVPGLASREHPGAQAPTPTTV